MSLQVRDLSIGFPSSGSTGVDGSVVAGVDLDLHAGQTLGLVGQSGSGKSLVSLAMIGLLPQGAVAQGQVIFGGRNLLDLPEREMCAMRGRRIGMVFQEPMSALNPTMRIGAQISEGLRLHQRMSRKQARGHARDWMERMRIARAAERLDSYPHELSGGQRQRVGLAIALALRPDVLIADEPTTALDVTVQAEILAILQEQVRDLGIALMLISHDLGVVAQLAQRVAVFYHGRKIEEGRTAQVLHQPQAEHTRALIAALPARARAELGGGV